MSEVLRGKALALVVESATVTDESGRPVDLEELREDVAPITAETVAAEDAAAIDEANARDDEEFAEELALADVPTDAAPEPEEQRA